MFAADAVARLSGTVGVAAVTAGPGNLLHSFCLTFGYICESMAFVTFLL